MSEENTQETTQEETIEQSQPALNLDSTVKVDGEEVSVRDLISARDEVVQLKEYNQHAKTLISPTGSDDLSRENAVRYLMTQEGYTSQDIEEYISWTNQPQEEVQPEPEYIPQENISQEEGESYDPEELLQQQEQYRMQQQQEMMMREQEQQRMNQIEDRQQRLGAEMMKKELNNALQNAMSTDENIKKLMNLESGGENRQEILKHEVESAMLESLRNRRAAGENFKPDFEILNIFVNLHTLHILQSPPRAISRFGYF